MKTLDLDEIRRKAEAATSGPWRLDEHDQSLVWMVGGLLVAQGRGCGRGNDEDIRNAAHIVEVDPPTALAMVDEIERQQRCYREGMEIFLRTDPVIRELAEVAGVRVGESVSLAAPSGLEKLKADLDRKTRLSEYADHKRTCASARYPRIAHPKGGTLPPKPCDCGFAELTA